MSSTLATASQTGVRPNSAQLAFSVAELVNEIASYLLRDRVDLLTLAAVSKRLRPQLLGLWARHLDLPFTQVANRLRFFQANPLISRHVQYLRIRDDISVREYSDSSRMFEETPKLALPYDELHQLLALIHEQKSQQGTMPFIDCLVGDKEDIIKLLNAFSPLKVPRMGERVSAIRIGPTGRHAHGYESDDESFGFDQDAEYERQEESNENWTELVHFIAHAQKLARHTKGPGLVAFQYGDPIIDPDEASMWATQVFPPFWTGLSKVASDTLRDLTVALTHKDWASKVLPRLKFANLNTLRLSQDHFTGTDQLEAFLDRHSTIMHLNLQLYENEQPWSMRQTFPKLASVEIFAGDAAEQDQTDFVSRHVSLVSSSRPFIIKAATKASADDQDPVLHKLRICATSDLNVFEDFAKRGGRLSEVHIQSGSFRDESDILQRLRNNSWLTRVPSAAQAITCLSIHIEIMKCDLDELRATFSSDFLPNLTELSITYFQAIEASEDEPSANATAKRNLRAVFHALVSARSLRILHLTDRCQRFSTPDILVDAVFPSALEYFVWLKRDWNRPQHFRFVSAHPYGQIEPIEVESGEGRLWGKRGRLQCIPAMWQQKISSDGVWDRPLGSFRDGIVLDHSSFPPTWALS
ncbi:hypothetical protein A4X13_0g5773 [Tilletia indica]|uniref:Uncharacterized protein n=1 Tax=Tilletia indica TaxID=43049 RepID=A0A177TBK6_9BASI|nr:hypothetical protein A4X13_0g5773 [Tilletia indica]